MIDGTPKIMSLTVDLHEHLVQMPTPMAGFQTLDPPFSDLRSKQWTEPMPPKSNGLVAHVDAAFVQQIFQFLSDSGNRTYIITARRMISGLVLK